MSIEFISNKKIIGISQPVPQRERALMVHGLTETFNTPEKASHNMLETQVNSHCNVTIIGYL